jgi:hypothetical protein
MDKPVSILTRVYKVYRSPVGQPTVPFSVPLRPPLAQFSFSVRSPGVELPPGFRADIEAATGRIYQRLRDLLGEGELVSTDVELLLLADLSLRQLAQHQDLKKNAPHGGAKEMGLEMPFKGGPPSLADLKT